MPQLKICSLKDCEHKGEPQPIDNFYKRNRGTKSKARCKDCVKKYVRKHYRDNREKYISVSREWAQDEGNREKRRITRRKWRKANQEKCRKYWKDNRDKYVSSKLKRMYGITLEEWKSIILSQGDCCDCCGEKFSYNHHFDLDYPTVHRDHETGKVIGIWHKGCNAAEGNIRSFKRAESLAKRMKILEPSSAII